jgi:predicted PurR-regulated permease PerM
MQEPLEISENKKLPEKPASSRTGELLTWQRRFFSLGTIMLIGLLVWFFIIFCRYLHEVASLIGYSVLIAYLLIGLVDWLEAKKLIRHRGLAIFIVYAGIVTIGSLFSLFIVPNLISQIESLASQLPSFPEKIQGWLDIYNFKISQTGLPFLNIDWDVVSQQITQFIRSFSQKFLSRILELAFGTISLAVMALATIVLSVYFLLDGPKIWEGLVRPLSKRYVIHADKLRDSLNRCLRGYFIGQVQLASLSGIYVFFMYLLLGSRYALLLGIWQALIEIIPVVGGFMGIGLGVIIMLFDSPWKALIAVIAYFAYTQIIKDNFLTPRIMGNAIGLHPVMVIVVVLIGAKVGGISGVVFALPIAGLLNVIFNYYLENRKEEEEEPTELGV